MILDVHHIFTLNFPPSQHGTIAWLRSMPRLSRCAVAVLALVTWRESFCRSSRSCLIFQELKSLKQNWHRQTMDFHRFWWILMVERFWSHQSPWRSININQKSMKFHQISTLVEQCLSCSTCLTCWLLQWSTDFHPTILFKHFQHNWIYYDWINIPFISV